MCYDGYCFEGLSIEDFKQFLTDVTDTIDFLLSSDISDYEETRINFYEEHEYRVNYCAGLIDDAERYFAEGYFSPELSKSLKSEFPIINGMYTELIDKTEKLKSLLNEYYERQLCDDNLLFNSPDVDD